MTSASISSKHGSPFGWSCIFSGLFAIVFGTFWLGVLAEIFMSGAPSSQPVPLWLTSQAQILTGDQMTPGQPVVDISFEEFQERAKDKPYLIFFWKGWEEGAVRKVGKSLPTDARAVVYLLEDNTGQVRVYFKAVDPIATPQEMSEWNRSYVIEVYFDKEQKIFYREVTPTNAWLYILLMTLALTVLSFVSNRLASKFES